MHNYRPFAGETAVAPGPSVKGELRVSAKLDPRVAEVFRRAADERDVAVQTLLRRLLLVVAGTASKNYRDNLITAILDDQGK